MDTQKNIEERVWDFVNGILPAKERDQVQELINTDSQWRKIHEEIISFESLVKKTELEEPSMRFSKNVMDEIAKLKIAPATKTYINPRIIYSIAAFFVLMIGTVIWYFVSQSEFSAGSGSTLPQVNTEGLITGWKKYLSPTVINFFFLADAVIALMLADRYFSKKKRELRESRGITG